MNDAYALNNLNGGQLSSPNAFYNKMVEFFTVFRSFLIYILVAFVVVVTAYLFRMGPMKKMGRRGKMVGG